MTAPPTETPPGRNASRTALREELARGRAALRSGRAAIAAEAAHRLPRWRPSRGHAAETPQLAPPLPEAGPPAPLPAERASVYASLLRDAGVSAPEAKLPRPEPKAETAAPEPPGPEAYAPEACAPKAGEPEPPPPPPEPEAATTLDLSEIAELGPGMRVRLRLLGCLDIADLAQAEPAPLREALGEISRLLNVEAWIAEARRLAAKPG